MAQYNMKDGRVWVQEKKFEPYKLLLPYGLSNVTDPAGSSNPVREPDPNQRGASVVVDVIQSEPGLPTFDISTRLYKTLNRLFKYKNRRVNFQAHLGACGRPDSYNGSEIMMHWESARRQDLGTNDLTQIQGDDAPIEVSTSFAAEVGPLLVDFELQFGSQINFAEGQAINAIAMLTDICDDISNQEEPGDVGYLFTAAGATIYAVADVWYTLDAWETPINVSTDPFGSSEDISDGLVFGTAEDHRVLCSRGTTDGSNPAEVAYADVTEPGTVTWVNVDVGSVNGEYITAMAAATQGYIFAVTTDGTNGRIYLSLDGGATWSLKKTISSTPLLCVAALFDGNVYAGGNTGVLYHSSDNGENWTQVTLASSWSSQNVTAVHITPDGTVYIGGASGALHGSYDEGDNWTVLPVQGATPTIINAIDGDGDSNIFVAGDIDGPAGRVWRSVDGGAIFRLWNLAIPTNAGLNDIFVVDRNFPIVGGDVQGGQGFLAKAVSNIVG